MAQKEEQQLKEDPGRMEEQEAPVTAPPPPAGYVLSIASLTWLADNLFEYFAMECSGLQTIELLEHLFKTSRLWPS